MDDDDGDETLGSGPEKCSSKGRPPNHDGWVITVEDWAEIRYLHASQGMSIRVRAAGPSRFDGYEPGVRVARVVAEAQRRIDHVCGCAALLGARCHSDLLRTNRILLEEQLEQNQGDAIPPMSVGPGGLAEEPGDLGSTHGSRSPTLAFAEGAGEPTNERRQTLDAAQGDLARLRSPETCPR